MEELTILETPIFTAWATSSMSDENYRLLQLSLLTNPTQGRIIKGSGGIRKVRWGSSQRTWPIGQGGIQMKNEQFQDLLQSVKQGGAILRGEADPSRSFSFEDIDIAAIRAEQELTQEQFADLFGINIRTLRNWEQGRRIPRGPARILLQLISKYPKEFLSVVHRIQ